MLQEFEGKQSLMNAYRTYLSTLQGVSDMAAKMNAIEQCLYVPHLYRGGYVIPGFGYSTERIHQGFVTKTKAGDPYLVNHDRCSFCGIRSGRHALGCTLSPRARQ